MVWASILNPSESGSVKREIKRWSVDVCLYFYHLYLFGFLYILSFSLFFLLFLSTFPSFHFLPFFPPPPLPSSTLLFIATPFYTIYHGEIYHFYPSTAFGSLWVSFQDYPLASWLLSQYHCSECVCCTTLHSQTKLLVLFFTSLCFSLSSSK